MGVEVDERDGQEGRLPRQAESGDDVHDAGGEGRDQTVLVQIASHRDEGGEPHEGIPRRTFGEALLPSDNAGDEENGQAVERGGDGADAKPAGNKSKRLHKRKQAQTFWV